MALDRAAIATSLAYAPPRRRGRDLPSDRGALRSIVVNACDAVVADGLLTWNLKELSSIAPNAEAASPAVRGNPYGARLLSGDRPDAATLAVPVLHAPNIGHWRVELMVPDLQEDVRVWIVFTPDWGVDAQVAVDIDGRGRFRAVGPFIPELPSDLASESLLSADEAFRGTVRLLPEKEGGEGASMAPHIRVSSDHRAIRFLDGGRQSWGSVCELECEEQPVVDYVLEPSLLEPGWNTLKITATLTGSDGDAASTHGFIHALKLPLPYGAVGASLDKIDLTRAVSIRGEVMRSCWVWNASPVDAEVVCTRADVSVSSLKQVAVEAPGATAEEPHQLAANAVGIASLLFGRSSGRRRAKRTSKRAAGTKTKAPPPPRIEIQAVSPSNRVIAPTLPEAVAIQEMAALEGEPVSGAHDEPVFVAEEGDPIA